MIKKNLVIIGGGAAGLSAAISAYDNGEKDILIIERDDHLGGILYQCIHNGFGLEKFKEELTGPEYAARLIDQVNERNISYILNAQVLSITKNKTVTYSSLEGYVSIEANAIILASGSYERTAGAIMVPGKRLNGVLTAGTAQRYMNIKGYMIGKRVVILGSGDIGLIMARRLTLEGAQVICVAEIMPYSNGLNRNIVQCLNDYNIPLKLSTTVSKIIGGKRVEKIVLSKVDENKQAIPGTEEIIDADTLILSVGLIPYTTLLDDLNLHYGKNKGAIVDENYQSEIPGLFTCGNCLHIHDLVDYVSFEGETAGKAASEYIKENNGTNNTVINVENGNCVGYVVPNVIHQNTQGKVFVKYRVTKPISKGYISFCIDNKEFKKIKFVNIVPSIMQNVSIEMDQIKDSHVLKVGVVNEL